MATEEDRDVSKETQHEMAGQLAWLLNLLSVTYVIAEAKTVQRMQEIGRRIAKDPLITEDNKIMLRLIYNARLEQIQGQPHG